jgi:exosome complex protein LRP1
LVNKSKYGIVTLIILYIVYLTTQGVNPKDHSIKHELDRIQKYMHKANIIGGRLKGEVPRINKGAAKRFVRNALYDDEQKT